MDRIRSVIKRYGIVVAVTVVVTAIATTLLLTVYGEEGEEKGSREEAVIEAERLKREKDLEAADRVVYEWIAAQVEIDEDRLRKVVTSEAVKSDEGDDLLESGEHAFPGDEEEMGERYLIERYDKYYGDGKLFYRVEYYFPNHARENRKANEKVFSEIKTGYLMLVKENGRWKATSIFENGLYSAEGEFERLFPERRNVLKAEEIGGVTVHEMKE
mgnify:CR=1 FL=1